MEKRMGGAVWRAIDDPKTFLKRGTLKRGMLKSRLAAIDAELERRNGGGR